MVKTNTKKLKDLREHITLNTLELLKINLPYFMVAGESEAGLLLEMLTEEITAVEEVLFPLLTIFVSDDTYRNLIHVLLNRLNRNIVVRENHLGTNLLIRAAAFGAKVIVQLLLEKGADPLQSDHYGHTPLHKAVETDQVETAKLLIAAAPEAINIQDNQGFTPLHIAALKQNNAIVGDLLRAGVNPNLRIYSGANYIQLWKLAAKGAYLEPLVLTPINLGDFNISRGVANYFNAILFDNEDFFAEAIQAFQLGLNTLPKDARNHGDAEKALHLLVDIYDIFKCEGNNELQQYIIKHASDWEKPLIKARLYCSLCSESLDNYAYEMAEVYANEALKAYQQQSEKGPQLQHDIFFNLGLCHSLLYDLETAFYWFEEAAKVAFYFKLNKVEFALNEIERVQNDDFRRLLAITICLHTQQPIDIDKLLRDYEFSYFNEQWLAAATDGERFLCFNILAAIDLSNKNYASAVSQYNQSLQYCTSSGNITNQLGKILFTCRQSDAWDTGLVYIQWFYQQYPEVMQSNDYLLKYQELIFYEYHHQFGQADDCLNAITQSECPEFIKRNILFHAKFIRITTEIENKNYDTALAGVSELDIENREKQQLVQFIEKLIRQPQEEQISLIQLPSENNEYAAQQPIIAESKIIPDAINETENTLCENTEKDLHRAANIAAAAIDLTHEEDIFLLEPKAIHQYFQKKKQSLIHQNIVEKNKATSYVWTNEEGRYPAEDRKTYEITNGWFAAIDSKVEVTLDIRQLEQFRQTLQEKKIVRREHRSNGIKLIPNKCIELKINADIRLVATQLYQNADGQHLIIFDKIMNHEKVTKLTKNSAPSQISNIARSLSIWNFDDSKAGGEDTCKSRRQNCS